MLAREEVELEFNVPIKMRDGTILYADIYRPASNGRCPAILTRLPYDKEMLFAALGPGYMNPRRLARAGQTPLPVFFAPRAPRLALRHRQRVMEPKSRGFAWGQGSISFRLARCCRRMMGEGQNPLANTLEKSRPDGRPFALQTLVLDGA